MNQDEKIKQLLSELATVLNDAFTDNDQIQDTIRNIESEGYHVDLFLASITRVLKKERPAPGSSFNAFDRSFLHSLRINPD